MIDLEKEEFLQRLDIRIAAISTLIQSHESLLCQSLDRKSFIETQKKISQFHEGVLQQLHDLDQQTQKRFAEFREEIAKKNCENEQNTGEVRIYFPMNGKERCFGSTDESYKLVLHLLLDCGYKIKSEINSPTSWLAKKIYLEYAEKLGVEL